jgi:hypothetical protein
MSDIAEQIVRRMETDIAAVLADHERDLHRQGGRSDAFGDHLAGLLEGIPCKDVRKAVDDVGHPLPNVIHHDKYVPLSIEGYEAGLVGIELHFWIPGDVAGGRSQDLVAHFYGIGVVGNDDPKPLHLSARSPFGFHRETKFAELLERRMDVPVLVCIREIPEDREGMECIRRIPRWIGLEFAHELGGDFADGSDVVAGFPVLGKRELDLLGLLLGRCPVVACELPPAVVEGRPEVVERIPDQQTPRFRAGGFTIDSDVESPRIVIEIFPEGIV